METGGVFTVCEGGVRRVYLDGTTHTIHSKGNIIQIPHLPLPSAFTYLVQQ